MAQNFFFIPPRIRVFTSHGSDSSLKHFIWQSTRKKFFLSAKMRHACQFAPLETAFFCRVSSHWFGWAGKLGTQVQPLIFVKSVRMNLSSKFSSSFKPIRAYMTANVASNFENSGFCRQKKLFPVYLVSSTMRRLFSRWIWIIGGLALLRTYKVPLGLLSKNFTTPENFFFFVKKNFRSEKEEKNIFRVGKFLLSNFEGTFYLQTAFATKSVDCISTFRSPQIIQIHLESRPHWSCKFKVLLHVYFGKYVS